MALVTLARILGPDATVTEMTDFIRRQPVINEIGEDPDQIARDSAPVSTEQARMQEIYSELAAIERQVSWLQTRERELRKDAINMTGVKVGEFVSVTGSEVIYARKLQFTFEYTLDDPCFVVPVVRIEGSPQNIWMARPERRTTMKRTVSFPKWRFPLLGA